MVHVIIIHRVAVHQRAGVEEQHTGTRTVAEEAVDAAELVTLRVLYRKQVAYRLELVVEPINNRIPRLLTILQLVDRRRRRHRRRFGIKRARSVPVEEPPIVVCDKRTALEFHIVHIALIYVIRVDGVDILHKDLGLTDLSGHIGPNVTVPAGVGSPHTDGTLVAVPTPLIPQI